MVIKNPVPQTEALLHLSASSISTLIECPREFLYHYIQGQPPQDTSAALVLGSAVHEAIAFWYNSVKQSGTEPSLADLIEVAAAAIEAPQRAPISFKKGETIDSLIAQATAMLKAFMATGYRPSHILAVEQKFVMPLVNPFTGEQLPECLLGTFDLVEERDGHVIVTDHKTAARIDNDKVAAPDTQMALYAFAARQLFDVDDVGLQYQFLQKSKIPAVTLQTIARHDPAKEERGALTLAASASTIISLALTHPYPHLVLPKHRSWRCSGCGYRTLCAAQD
ncbi:PD-(D/E)XK nuclease family protein [Myxococcota bacterium]|nr:PD-(D/E)XK nuclease family protein [Myxococcota bacterium]